MRDRARPLIIGVLLGALSTLGMATAASPARQADLLLSEARLELAEARSLVNAAAHSPGARQRLQERLGALDGTLSSLDRTLDVLQEPPAPVAVSAGELRQIQGAVAAESFSDDRLEVLRDAARGRHFTTAQVIALMDLFSFSDDKIDAAALLYPSVVDPQSWYTVYGSLTFSGDKAALRARTR